MPATLIYCAACGADFSFSEEEQAFYESKGFQPPRKCKPCRDTAKQNRNGGSGGYGGNDYASGNSYGRSQRQMYEVVCAGCHTNTQVPFEPNGSKPVYCRDCFQQSRAY